MKSFPIGQAPLQAGYTRVDFDQQAFDVLVNQKGYTVTIEKSIHCPCTYRDNAAQSSCLNCLGSGWIYTDGIQLKGVITSINFNNEYRPWSTELLGTAYLTVENKYQFSFMDRVTIKDSFIYDSEVSLVKEMSTGEKYIFTTYEIEEISHIYKFQGPNEALQKLVEDVDYTYDGYKILFLTCDKDDAITVRYKHALVYAVIDMPHEVRNSYKVNERSRESQLLMPVNVVIRRFHYILDKAKFSGDSVITN